MASTYERSRKRRKVFSKTPGGKNVIRFIQRKPKKASCAECGAELHGTPNPVPNKMKKLAKSERRPERPYGGNLCSRCMRNKIKLEASVE